MIPIDHNFLTVTLRLLANYSKTAAHAFGAVIFFIILWRGNERKVG